MSKKYKYHNFHSYLQVEDNVKINTITQLYKVGVYCAIYINDGKIPEQFSLKPSDIVKIEKKLKEQEEKEEIKDLKFGRLLTVIKNKEGFYEELKT